MVLDSVIHRVFLSGAVVLSLLTIASCDENETRKCKACSNSNTNDFDKKYLRYIFDAGTQSQLLFELDSATGVTTEYKICNAGTIGSLETRKVVSAAGQIFNSCEKNLTYILLNEFEAVQSCTPNPATIIGSFALERKWYIYSVSDGTNTTIIPCESSNLNPYLSFTVSAIEGVAALNAFSGSYSKFSSDEINVPELFISQFAGTASEAFFENKFFKTFSGGAVVYSIENNLLTLSNTVNNHSIKLFSK